MENAGQQERIIQRRDFPHRLGKCLPESIRKEERLTHIIHKEDDYFAIYLQLKKSNIFDNTVHRKKESRAMNKIWLGIISLILILGCVKRPPSPPQPGPLLEEVLVSRSHDPPPDWIKRAPEYRDEYLYFVGLSEKVATEKVAREDAHRHAVDGMAKYTGTDVEGMFIEIQESEGVSSEILDPTIATEEFKKHFSEAFIRRVKDREWYTEKWKRRYKRYSEYYFKVCVLARVPKREIDRAIEERCEHHRQVARAAKSANEQLRVAKRLVVEGGNMEASCPVQAFAKFRKAIELAEEVRFSVREFTELNKLGEEANSIIASGQEKIRALEENPEAVFIAGVLSLAGEGEPKPITVVLAKVNYQDTDLSSQFSRYLAKKLEEILARKEALFTVIGQRTFQEALRKEQLSIEDCLSSGAPRALGLELNGLVFGRYWERQTSIEVVLDLSEVGTGRVIGSTSVDLLKDSLPPEIALKPGNYDIATVAVDEWDKVEAESEDLEIKVWPDKGKGTLYYKKDEKMFVFFKSNRGCYLRLYHTDASGAMQQLFPNSYHPGDFISGGRVHRIPDETMNFDFVIKPPYGAEIIKAVASLLPFPHEEAVTGSGRVFRPLGTATEENIRSTIERDIEVLPKENLAEDTCIFTTIER